jgi:spermidine/putrescine transport system substrate-binding protein
MHPKERRSLAATRREFLARTGGAAFALSGASGLLAACSNSTTTAGSTVNSAGQKVGPGGLPLARPNRRVTLPLWEQPIPSGMKPETGGQFTIFNYPEYIYGALLKEFGKKYNVTVKVTPFDDINTGVAKLASGAVQPDVTEMTPDNLDRVVAGHLIKPINLDYIPNLKKNVWPSLVDPFYDVGSRYGVPYTAYATGIAWRTDQVKVDIPSMSNPWDIFWQAQAYKGKTALLSEVRETIAMALLRKGELDINTEDPAKINAAVADLQELYNVCNIKVGDLQYSTIPENKAWLNQAWSGDMMSAFFYYLPNKATGPLLRFWHPVKGKGPIQNDMWSVCTSTKKPVLAHLFLNFMLDNTNAYSNFVNFNGYQPPLNEIVPEDLVKKKVIPETLSTCVLTESDLGPDSLQEMTLTTTGQSLWQNGYSTFLSGA